MPDSVQSARHSERVKTRRWGVHGCATEVPHVKLSGRSGRATYCEGKGASQHAHVSPALRSVLPRRALACVHSWMTAPHVGHERRGPSGNRGWFSLSKKMSGGGGNVYR